MVKRKKPVGKHIWLSEEDKRRSDELKENEFLGLTDSDIYGTGLTEYETKLDSIKRELDEKSIFPEPEFLSTYHEAIRKIRGEQISATDEFGFPKNRSIDTFTADDPFKLEINLSKDQAPPAGLLDFFSLSVESWFNLLESERLELVRIWEEKLRYGNV
jgi:hypothetical protein